VTSSRSVAGTPRQGGGVRLSPPGRWHRARRHRVRDAAHAGVDGARRCLADRLGSSRRRARGRHPGPVLGVARPFRRALGFRDVGVNSTASSTRPARSRARPASRPSPSSGAARPTPAPAKPPRSRRSCSAERGPVRDTGFTNVNIYAVNPDGSDLVRLTNNSSDDFGVAWSPDGKKLSFASNRDGNGETSWTPTAAARRT